MTTVYIKSSGNWVVPTGVTSVSVTLYGGGAGGAGGLYCAGYSYGGYAANGGAASVGVTTDNISVTPGSTLYISIGDGGLPGSGNSTCSATNTGYNGGDTTFPGAYPGVGALGSRAIHVGNYAYPGTAGVPLDGLSPGSYAGQTAQYGGAASPGYGAGGGGGGQNGTSMGYSGGKGAPGICVITYTVVLPPNMVAGSFDVQPRTVQVNGTITATQVVNNTGGSSGTTTVTFTAGDLMQIKTATIAAGGTATLSATWVVASAGTLSVCATLS
jgi:hypothetical protein